MAIKALTHGHAPGAMNISKVTFGIASDSPEVSLIASDVGALSTLFTVPVGAFVTNLIVVKRTAFGSTGAMTMNVGDTDDDGFIESTDLIATDVGVVSMVGMHTGSTGAAVTVAYRSGRLYTSDDTLNIGVTIGTAAINAGLADAYLVWFDTREALVS